MGWNLLMKQAGDRYIITWWALAFGALAFAALPVQAWPELRPVFWIGLISACCQFAYYICLNFAYNTNDFSLVYPIARGTAPILIALWSVLFLAERVPWIGVVGLGLIIAGVMLIGSGAWRALRHLDTRPSLSTFSPFLISLCISSYSVIDGGAVKQVSPLPYTVLVFSLNVLLLTPFVWSRYGHRQMLAVGHRHWWRIALIGLGVYTAYGLVLTAYALAPVSYVGAVREMSIVLAAVTGWFWLGEPFGRMRTVGSLVVCAGILLVTVAG
jgi:drug/metabolite transporter (DMT)-like permease